MQTNFELQHLIVDMAMFFTRNLVALYSSIKQTKLDDTLRFVGRISLIKMNQSPKANIKMANSAISGKELPKITSTIKVKLRKHRLFLFKLERGTFYYNFRVS